MDEILNFLTDTKIFYLATIGNGKPHVRPLGFVMECNGKLAFATSKNKSMYKQMLDHPDVEFSACNSKGQTLRIIGSVSFDDSKYAKEKAFEIMPDLKKAYSLDDPIFQIFFLEKGSATISDFSGNKETIQLN